MKPILLTILDGFGLREETKGNAISHAKMPNFDYLYNKYPHSKLVASGTLVGLPEGQMGNSEVGHLNIGAGRIVYQPLQIVTNSIVDGSFFNNEVLLDAINHAKLNDSKLHIMGLLSDGGVHSHIDHIFAIIDMAKMNNVSKLYVHVFTDGRDTLPNIAASFVSRLVEKLNGFGKIASISGRFYSMDRDKKWDRTKKAYDVIVGGSNYKPDVYSHIKDNLTRGIMDEFIEPALLDKDGTIGSNDAILFANFRTDRAPQILTPITNVEFNDFVKLPLNNIKLSMLMPANPSVIGRAAFGFEKLDNTLGAFLSSNNKTQLRIAETEKYAHVTFFFDGGTDYEIPGCDRILVKSPLVQTYDLQPEMSAIEVENKLIAAIESDKYDFILLNFANPDMVGHTGNMDAAVTALEALDFLIGKIYEKISEKNGLMIITADHGNVEHMLDGDTVLTAHTTNKVPFVICDNNYIPTDGILADIAPTILDIMGIEKPSEMTGRSLLTKKVD